MQRETRGERGYDGFLSGCDGNSGTERPRVNTHRGLLHRLSLCHRF